MEIEKEEKKGSSIGPGLITGAADDDPSGIATYSQTGAQTGFGLLWLSFFTLPFMIIIQEMSARISLVTGRGLAENIRKYFPRKVILPLAFLLVIANTINIGADLSIMAAVVSNLLPEIPVTFSLIAIAVFSVFLEIFVSYKKYSSYLKWMTLVLLAYVLTGFLVDFNFKDLLYHAFVPAFGNFKEDILLITAILGTTISPYLFFWQASQEIEDEIAIGDNTFQKRREDGKKKIGLMRRDVCLGMFFSNLIMFFIIAVCAETLSKYGITDIQSASDAAEALRPLAGNFAYFLFSLGIIGTGLLAIPVIAGSSAYVISETFGWKEGLYRKWYEAKAFYGVILVSVLVGILFSLLDINPIKSLIYSSVLNGLIAPFIILIILLIARNPKIMAENKNNRLIDSLGWVLFILMSAVGCLMIFEFLFNR